jgi:lipoprotein NlpI
MTLEDGARRLPPIGAILVLILAGFLYAGMMGCLLDIHRGGNDAFGRGLDAGFAMVFGIALWLMLGLLLLIGGIKGEMPDWSAILATLLWPLSALSAAMALDFIERDGSYMIVPGLLPPVIAAYAMWSRLTGLHHFLRPLPTSIVAWIAIALIAAVPLPRHFIEWHEKRVIAAKEAAEAEKEAAAEAEKQRLNLERFEKLTADSPLWDYAVFFGKDNSLDGRAIAAALALPRRQADAEEALRRDMGFPLIEYNRLGLSATPAFCSAANDFLSRDAAAHRAPNADVEFTETARPYTDPDDLSVIESLTARCDIDDAVQKIRDAVGSYKQTSSRDAYLAVLAWRRGNGFRERDDNTRALAEYDEALRLRPDNDQFHKMRGDLYALIGRLDDAIADYDEAVRLNPGYSEAFFSRGNAYSQKGDDDKALASFDEAIRLNSGLVGAYNNRGLVYVRQGKLDLALADFDAAVQNAPDFRLVRLNRVQVHFYRGEYADAASDAATALHQKADDPYTVLLLYLARLHANQDAAGGLTTDVAQLDPSLWPYPILAALLDQRSAQSVLAEASSGSNPDRKNNECDAAFYFGDKAFAEGDIGAARPLLEQASANCPAGVIEVTLTKYELARLP